MQSGEWGSVREVVEPAERVRQALGSVLGVAGTREMGQWDLAPEVPKAMETGAESKEAGWVEQLGR